jgi:hypothetical protein
MDNEEKTLAKITLTWADGSSEEIDKGLVARFELDDDGGGIMTSSMIGLSGGEMEAVVSGFVRLGFEMGMFEDENPETGGEYEY